MPRDGRPIPPEPNLRCCSCGYDLTGLTVRRCPECGEPFDPRETWLANERSPRRYRLENFPPLTRIAGYAALVVLIVVFVLLLLNSGRQARFTGMLVIIGEVLVYYYGFRPLATRLIYLTFGITWMLVMWLVDPFG